MSKKTGLLPSSDRRDAGCATASLRALFELVVAARPNCSGREPPVTAHGQRRLARKGPESGPSQWRRRPRVRPGNLCCELHERETSLSPRSPCTELSPAATLHPPEHQSSTKHCQPPLSKQRLQSLRIRLQPTPISGESTAPNASSTSKFTHMSATTKAPGLESPRKKATQFISPVSKQEIHCTLQPEQA